MPTYNSLGVLIEDDIDQSSDAAYHARCAARRLDAVYGLEHSGDIGSAYQALAISESDLMAALRLVRAAKDRLIVDQHIIHPEAKPPA